MSTSWGCFLVVEECWSVAGTACSLFAEVPRVFAGVTCLLFAGVPCLLFAGVSCLLFAGVSCLLFAGASRPLFAGMVCSLFAGLPCLFFDTSSTPRERFPLSSEAEELAEVAGGEAVGLIGWCFCLPEPGLWLAFGPEGGES